MKFKFNPNQQYQLDAILAVTSLFKGQTPIEQKFGVDKGVIHRVDEGNIAKFRGGYITGYGNQLNITNEQLNQNLKALQKKYSFVSSNNIKAKGKNFSIEMETGTGKTYTYLRTLFELNKQYRFSKFIIVVPSIAVREGVLKSLQIMKSHFEELYGHTPYKQFIYQSKKIIDLRDFATGYNPQIMIINIDAFNKDKNIIHSPRDNMGGAKPIEFVEATKPIVIIDEAQNMESEKSKEAIRSLNPLFTLRYSATHKNPYNLIYRLGPVEAFQKKLVKKISVLSVVEENDPTKAYIKVLKITNKNNKITCTLQFFKNTKESKIKTKKVVKQHEDLFILSNKNQMYTGFKITEINCTPHRKFVGFANGIKLNLRQEQGGAKKDIIKAQIRETIKTHFEKERQLKNQGIKVLSLFFLDKVENYRIYKDGKHTLGIYGKWFEQIYKEVFIEYGPQVAKNKVDSIIPVEQIHDGYFSKDKKGTWKNTQGNSKEDKDTYSLIMKDKEELLNIQKHKKRKKANLNKKTLLDPEFKKFWNKISQKTIYSVHYETKDLVAKASHAVKNMEAIPPIQLTTNRADINIQSQGISATLTRTPKKVLISQKPYLPDILDYMQKKIPITKRTIFNILKQASRWDDFVNNPQKFMDQVAQEIQAVLQNLIIEGIKYEKLDKLSYEMSQFQKEEHKVEFLEDKVIPTKKSVYDYIYYESKPEKKFAESLENIQSIKYFIKLPKWFKVSTPVGDYNPDWAILKQNGNVVYMIRETKANLKPEALRPLEKSKATYGQKHFESIGVHYKVCTSIEDADLNP